MPGAVSNSSCLSPRLPTEGSVYLKSIAGIVCHLLWSVWAKSLEAGRCVCRHRRERERAAGSPVDFLPHLTPALHGQSTSSCPAPQTLCRGNLSLPELEDFKVSLTGSFSFLPHSSPVPNTSLCCRFSRRSRAVEQQA